VLIREFAPIRARRPAGGATAAGLASTDLDARDTSEGRSSPVALTELKGRPLGTQRVVIERGPVRVFAQALLDDDAAYTADGAPVPPTFPFVMPYWGSLGQGGAAGLPIENLRGKGRAILHGEQEFVYHGGDWPHVGDTLVGDGQISDVYEKEKSSGGKLEFYVTETTWKNERTGRPVVTTRFTLAINCKADAAEPKPLS
jgi:N-terminal half of MaoC dehydratase